MFVVEFVAVPPSLIRALLPEFLLRLPLLLNRRLMPFLLFSSPLHSLPLAFRPRFDMPFFVERLLQE